MWSLILTGKFIEFVHPLRRNRVVEKPSRSYLCIKIQFVYFCHSSLNYAIKYSLRVSLQLFVNFHVNSFGLSEFIDYRFFFSTELEINQKFKYFIFHCIPS